MFDQLPVWLPDLGVSGIILLFGVSLSKNWMYTKGQVDELIAARKELAEVWKDIAKTNQATIRLQAEQLEPVVSSSAAILRIVEDLQRASYNYPRGDSR